jgi:RNA polymerase sigma factor (TIGR02999 family)
VSPRPGSSGSSDDAALAAQRQVTLLITAAQSGDPRAAGDLLPLVYDELRRLAAANMGREVKAGAGQTLQPTALVHEAYIRLLGVDGPASSWNSRGHFFGAAAIAMRRILIERARARNAAKRGGGITRVDLHDDAVAAEPDSDEKSDQIIALDSALTRLEALDPRKARVAMLRYFAGLSVEQTAAALDVSPATVKNDWAFARAWLSREIEAAGSTPSRPGTPFGRALEHRDAHQVQRLRPLGADLRRPGIAHRGGHRFQQRSAHQRIVLGLGPVSRVAAAHLPQRLPHGGRVAQMLHHGDQRGEDLLLLLAHVGRKQGPHPGIARKQPVVEIVRQLRAKRLQDAQALLEPLHRRGVDRHARPGRERTTQRMTADRHGYIQCAAQRPDG